MEVPQGQFKLERYPATPNPTLRAWDAADEYLLHHLDEVATADPSRLDGPWVVANDAFGALGVALADRHPQWWSDSWLAYEGLNVNLKANGRRVSDVDVVPSTDDPIGPVKVAVLKVPRTLALLEDQLHRLRPLLAPDAVVVAGGMVKAIHSSTLELFEQAIGTTTTSLARKKARLVFATLDPGLAPAPSPYPTRYELDGGMEVVGHANVFSRERLDIGTRFFLDHLPTFPDARRIVDVGCGNGILGTLAAKGNPASTVTFTDESHMAVASARETFAASFPGRAATFEVTDAVKGLPARSADVVLCNPPFHAQNAMGDRDAWEMFVGARRILVDGGEILVIGNRHLDYHAKLQRAFGNVQIVGSNPKFVVLRSVAPVREHGRD